MLLNACSEPKAEQAKAAAPSCTKIAGQKMQWIPAGRFRMGSNNGYPEEGPERDVSVTGFWIDTHELTNAEFAKFVAATGYKTTAERTPPNIPGAPEDMLKPGSAVFNVPSTEDPRWWRWKAGANWRHPEGPESSIKDRDTDPVVQISFEDAQAYAKWAGKDLPTEEQWEYAARGGLSGKNYAWGNTKDPNGKTQANYYQGAFPAADLGTDGYKGRAPIGCFAANGYGLYDMIGNVWEYTLKSEGPQNNMRVIKGGSYLCAENYCARYRPAARQFQELNLGTNHIGVRFVKNSNGPE
jgi:formylglycine-generating enzyme